MKLEIVWILIGWTLFVVSALLFAASSWRAGDWLAFGGSLAFLGANVAFLVALYLDRRL